LIKSRVYPLIKNTAIARIRVGIGDLSSGTYTMKLFYCGKFKEPIKVVKQKQIPTASLELKFIKRCFVKIFSGSQTVND
jgi:hypothetical protein